jgi:hypothetical protein
LAFGIGTKLVCGKNWMLLLFKKIWFKKNRNNKSILFSHKNMSTSIPIFQVPLRKGGGETKWCGKGWGDKWIMANWGTGRSRKKEDMAKNGLKRRLPKQLSWGLWWIRDIPNGLAHQPAPKCPKQCVPLSLIIL